jgi:ethanolaminephosphotransferase
MLELEFETIAFSCVAVLIVSLVFVVHCLTSKSESTNQSEKKRTRLFSYAYLNDTALVHLVNYQYKSGAYTKLDMLMTPFWNKSVEFLPMWMAPNLVTLIGLILCIIGELVIVSYSQDFSSEFVPSWAFYLFSIIVFIYQTLDAIDGKQARRTGEGSPLGQLFDHGCDACNLGIVLVATGIALNLKVTENGNFYLFALQYIVSFIPFAFATLEEYHTGILRTGSNNLGVTEIQFGAIVLFAVAGAFSRDVFDRIIMEFSLSENLSICVSFKQAFCVGMLLPNIFLVVNNIWILLKTDPECLPGNERGDKILGKYSSLKQSSPFFVLALLSWSWVFAPTTSYPMQHPLIWTYITGFTITLLTTKLIVIHMAKQPFPVLHTLMIPLVICNLNAYSAVCISNHSTVLDESYVAWVSLVAIILMYIHYVVIVIDQITTKLNKNCLTIKSKTKTV